MASFPTTYNTPYGMQKIPISDIVRPAELNRTGPLATFWASFAVFWALWGIFLVLWTYFWSWGQVQKLFWGPLMQSINFGFGSTALSFCFYFGQILGLFLRFLGLWGLFLGLWSGSKTFFGTCLFIGLGLWTLT